MTKKFLTATALACAVVAPTAASAAKFYAHKLECGSYPNCYALTIEGKIEQGDNVKFEEFLKKNNVNTAVSRAQQPGREPPGWVGDRPQNPRVRLRDHRA